MAIGLGRESVAASGYPARAGTPLLRGGVSQECRGDSLDGLSAVRGGVLPGTEVSPTQPWV